MSSNRIGQTITMVITQLDLDAMLPGAPLCGPVEEACKDYDAELYAVYLLQSKQRAGVGRTMTLRLAEELDRRGFKSMLVWVLEENPATSFYSRLGAVLETSKTISIGGKELQDMVGRRWKTSDPLSVTERCVCLSYNL